MKFFSKKQKWDKKKATFFKKYSKCEKNASKKKFLKSKYSRRNRHFHENVHQNISTITHFSTFHLKLLKQRKNNFRFNPSNNNFELSFWVEHCTHVGGSLVVAERDL